MNYKQMRKKNLFLLTIVALYLCFPFSLKAHTAAEMSTLVTQTETYLAKSTYTAAPQATDVRAILLDAVAQAKLSDDTNRDENYSLLEDALHTYLLAAQPTSGTSFDLTFKMNNPTLTSSGEGWSLTPTVNYNEAEIYNRTFDFYQTVNDLPSGIYTIGVTGFYRNSLYYSGIEKNANAGCYLYANDESSLLLTLYYDAQTKKFQNNTGGYANNMYDANQVFSQGFYATNTVRTTLGEGDVLRLGIRNTASQDGNWTCFKNFTLQYWGNNGGTVKSSRKYRIVSDSYSTVGAVVPGSTKGQVTPLYYSTTAVSGDTAYWYFTEEKSGKYSLRSAATKQYITWDGERIEASKRYVTLTDTMAGDSSLWTLNQVDGTHFCIRNVKQPEQLFDTRSGSYIVGTYNNSGAPSSIEQYLLYDIYGEQIVTLNNKNFFSGVSTLNINGKEMANDRSSSMFLCSVPLVKMKGGDYSATVAPVYKSGWSSLSIDGTMVNTSTSYTFKNIQPGKAFNLKIMNAEGDSATAKLYFTGMPVVALNGSFGDAYTKGTIAVNEPDSALVKLIDVKAKWRGATTKYRNKKQYAVKLIDSLGQSVDTCFFGLRSDNNWILDGMSIDVARMRNRVTTDLWEAYSQKPYFYDKQPDLVNGTRGRFVEMFLNDSYVGIYCMTEKMDRKQLQLRKYDETTNTIKGELWKSSDWSYAVFMGHYSNSTSYPKKSPVNYDNNSETWDSYEVKYPDMDDAQPINWSELYDAVDFVCTSSDQTFTEQVGSYFDMPVLLDYYIFMETILSADNHGKNMYFYIYNRAKDKKISFGPWDLDSTCGRRWNSAQIPPEQDYTQYIINSEHGDYNLFRRVKACNVNNFNDSVRYRYKELRRTVLNTDSIIQRFADYKELFDGCGASAREVARWNNTDAGTLNFDDELNYLTDWFRKRMNYIDTQWDIADLPDAVNNVEQHVHSISVGADKGRIIVTAPQACTITVVTLSGQVRYVRQVEAGVHVIDGIAPGIYIVNGRKIIVS
jgi:hypothetical protein